MAGGALAARGRRGGRGLDQHTTGDDLGAAYWDDDTVVVLRTEHLGEHGYLPHRITPDPHGRYPLSTGTWPWITPPAHRDPDSPHT